MDNIFDDAFDALIDDPAERAIVKMQSDLISNIRQFIKENNLTQAQAAKIFGVAQPRISDLINNKIKLLSLGTLVSMAVKANMDLNLEIKPKRAA